MAALFKSAIHFIWQLVVVPSALKQNIYFDTLKVIFNFSSSQKCSLVSELCAILHETVLVQSRLGAKVKNKIYCLNFAIFCFSLQVAVKMPCEKLCRCTIPKNHNTLYYLSQREGSKMERYVFVFIN